MVDGKIVTVFLLGMPSDAGRPPAGCVLGFNGGEQFAVSVVHLLAGAAYRVVEFVWLAGLHHADSMPVTKAAIQVDNGPPGRLAFPSCR